MSETTPEWLREPDVRITATGGGDLPAESESSPPAGGTTKGDHSKLLPCPFCGGDPESDTMQGFRRMYDGRLSNAVAIYCTKCTAQVSMCHDDHKEYAPDDLLTILIDAWNRRVSNKKVNDAG